MFNGGASREAGEPPVELVIIYVEKRISAENNRILRYVEGKAVEWMIIEFNLISPSPPPKGGGVVIMNYESWLLSVTPPLVSFKKNAYVQKAGGDYKINKR